MSLIATGNWQDALEPIARKNFQVGFKEVPADRDVIYSPKKTSKLTETYLELGDVGEMGDFDGDLDYDNVAQGYKMTITQTEKAMGMKLQRKFVETDQLDVVESLPKMQGLAARRRMGSDTYSIFNDAFSTAQLTIDGLQLCSSAHTSNQSGISTTQANRGTSALSPVALEAARIAMKAFMTNRNNLFEVVPDMIVVPRALEEAAFEIIKSNGKVDTANNNRNFHMGRYKMLVTDWLDDSNNWFLIDSELMKQMTVWNNVVPLEFKQANDFDGFVAKYAAYMFYGVGTRDWRWVYGSEVSG
jgi:phage major head subunit gpT-like protein